MDTLPHPPDATQAPTPPFDPNDRGLYVLQPEDVPANKLLNGIVAAIDAADQLVLDYMGEHERGCSCRLCHFIGRDSDTQRADETTDDLTFAHEMLLRIVNPLRGVVIPETTSEDSPESLDPLAAKYLDPVAVQTWNSSGAVAFRRVLETLREAETACKAFADHHGFACKCAYCIRGSGFNFNPVELRYEVEHIGHFIHRFVAGAHLECFDPYEAARMFAADLKKLPAPNRAASADEPAQIRSVEGNEHGT